MVVTLELQSGSPEETAAVGHALGQRLEAGDCLALRGELGAGKTTFTRGLAAGLGVDEPVTSPTYVLCAEYPARAPLLHLDAYFVERLEGVLAEGLVERFAGAVVVVEWAEHMADWLAADRLDLALTGEGERRTLRFSASGTRSESVLAALKSSLQELCDAEQRTKKEPGP